VSAPPSTCIETHIVSNERTRLPMIMRVLPTARSVRIGLGGSGLHGALALAIVALVAPVVSARLASDIPTAAVRALYAADEGLPGDGRPPSPGPTDPDGPSI
jgi:hypothetical protein